MKLLGWMHRKLRQNNGDVFKDFQTGHTNNSLSGRPSLDDHHQLSPIHSPRLQCTRPIKDRHVSTDEVLLFEGLLSIGTLGSTPIQEEQDEDQHEYQDQEEKEEYFAFALETIAEKEETEMASEADLIAVNMELEKVLIEAAEKDGDRLSSARPSHVGGKANEVCPLQEFLFGAVAEVATMAEKEKEKVKVKRASLGELFMIEEGGKDGEKRKEKGEDVMKKKKKKKMKRNESHKASDIGRGNDDSGYVKDAVKTAKFQKILQIFHKKIHPEDEMVQKKSFKLGKYKNKCTGISSGNNYSAGNGGNPLMTSSKRWCNELFYTLDGSNSTSSGEHWIKTDADYLVLELQNGITCTQDYPKDEVLVH